MVLLVSVIYSGGGDGMWLDFAYVEPKLFFRFHAGKFSSAAPILNCLILSFETRILSFEMPNDLFIAYIYCHAPKSAPVIPASNSYTPMGADMHLFFKRASCSLNNFS